MKLSFLLLCFVGILNYGQSASIVELTNENFDQIVGTNENVLVEFYAAGCQFCRNFVPIYESLAEELSVSHPDVVVARIEATVQTDITMRFGVEEMPSFYFFKFGEHFKHDSISRTKDKLAKFVKEKAHPRFASVGNMEEFDEWYDRQFDTSALVFLDKNSAEFAADLETFKRAATRLSDKFSFALTHNSEIMGEYNCQPSVPCLVVLLNRRLKCKMEQMARVGTFTDKMSLAQFVEGNSMPLVGEFYVKTKDRYNRIAKANNLLTVTVFHKINYMHDPKGSNYVANRVRKVATKFVGKALFAVSDVRESEAELDSSFGLLMDDAKGLVVVSDPSGTTYTFNGLRNQAGSFKTDGLEEFITSVLAGNETPFLKSQEPPKNPVDEDGVTTLTRRTFDELVVNSKKASFLFFYAPWHGECKTFEPKFREIAKEFKESEVQIAGYDVTVNALPEHFVLVSKVPGLFYVNKEGHLEAYEGKHEVEHIKTFLSARGF